MMALRIWLARKLDPEVYQRAERGRHLSGLVGDMWRWCGEFPDIDAAMGWIIGCQKAYWRKLDEPADERACNIDTFRERLRAKRKAESRVPPFPATTALLLRYSDEPPRRAVLLDGRGDAAPRNPEDQGDGA